MNEKELEDLQSNYYHLAYAQRDKLEDARKLLLRALEEKFMRELRGTTWVVCEVNEWSVEAVCLGAYFDSATELEKAWDSHTDVTGLDVLRTRFFTFEFLTGSHCARLLGNFDNDRLETLKEQGITFLFSEQLYEVARHADAEYLGRDSDRSENDEDYDPAYYEKSVKNSEELFNNKKEQTNAE